MFKDKLTAVAVAVIAALGLAPAAQAESLNPQGRYIVTCHEAIPGQEQAYVAALAAYNGACESGSVGEQAYALEVLERYRQVAWRAPIDNLVTTVGKNYLLDNGMAGSAYTAAFFMGLISSVSFTAVAAGDTMASHAGWLEAGVTNAPTFSGARKTAAWSAASGGSKALSAGLVFTFTGTGTVKGCFMTTGSVVDGTTGTLFSAGLFSGGDQPVVATNTLTVSYSLSL